MPARPDDPNATLPLSHCEWCGAEFDTPRTERPAPPAKPPAAAGDTGETHCEWCGAEYPVPDAGTTTTG